MGSDQVRRVVARRCEPEPWSAIICRYRLGGRCGERSWPIVCPSSPHAVAGGGDGACGRLIMVAGLQPGFNRPTLAAQADPEGAAVAMAGLRARGWLIRINDRQHVARPAMDQLITDLAAAFRAEQPVDVQWLKHHHGLTRKHAVPLAEWCDAHGVTQRIDVRVRGPRLDLADPSVPVPVLGSAPE